MAAVLRVKRRNDEEPLEALVIASKRRKTETGDETVDDPLTAVLKFAGTVKNQDDDVVDHLSKTLSKEELKANFKQHVTNVTGKARQQTRQESLDSRYKVVSCFRSLDSSKIQELDDKVMTVIDVVDSSLADAVVKETDDYVYDLYYTQTGDDMLIDNLVSVHPLQQELVFGSYRHNGLNSEDEYESEDSNSESNWRNDYPDSDHSENSIGEEDIRSAVKNMKIEDGSDLSSEDDFVYAVDESDVDRYGFKYAKYKARIKAEMSEDSDKESDVTGYSGEYPVEDIEDLSDAD